MSRHRTEFNHRVLIMRSKAISTHAPDELPSVTRYNEIMQDGSCVITTFIVMCMPYNKLKSCKVLAPDKLTDCMLSQNIMAKSLLLGKILAYTHSLDSL